jgi:hypothetical protein
MGPMHDHHDHDHDNELDEMTARVRALETILVDKGLVDPAAVDAIIDTYEHDVGPRNGAAVVARAWTDPDFADWLKRDATEAIASMGSSGGRGSTWSPCSTDPKSTTSSSARCVPATRGRCSACRPPGTSRPTTVRVPCASRARCCRNSA